MQANLRALYQHTVPQERRDEIDALLGRERAAAETRREAERRFSVFRVTEKGQEQYFCDEHPTDVLEAASAARRYLRKKIGDSTPLTSYLRAPTAIDREGFEDAVRERMEGGGRVAGVYDINFGRREFSVVSVTEGWQTFHLSDVSVAAYYASRSQHLKESVRLELFADKLPRRTVASPHHLSASQISFDGEMVAEDSALNFHLKPAFEPNDVFGPQVEGVDQNGWLLIRASFDVERRQVCDTLKIDFAKSDTGAAKLTYPLNAAERIVLHRQMDAHCLSQTGKNLEDYCTQIEEEQAPFQGPQLQ